MLRSFEDQYKDARARMSAFFQLKLVLAPVIEALILLDRLAFLLEQVKDVKMSSAFALPLFVIHVEGFFLFH